MSTTQHVETVSLSILPAFDHGGAQGVPKYPGPTCALGESSPDRADAKSATT